MIGIMPVVSRLPADSLSYTRQSKLPAACCHTNGIPMQTHILLSASLIIHLNMTPVTPKALTIRITYATAANLIVQAIRNSAVPVSIEEDVVHIQGLWEITARVNFILFKVPATRIFIICRVYKLLSVLLTSKAAAYVLPKAKF